MVMLSDSSQGQDAQHRGILGKLQRSGRVWHRFTFALKWVKHLFDKIDLTGPLSPGHWLLVMPSDCVASE